MATAGRGEISVGKLDGYLNTLMQCKPIPENDVMALCEQVGTLSRRVEVAHSGIHPRFLSGASMFKIFRTNFLG